MLIAKRTHWPIFAFFLLSCLFLWRIFAGEVFVPAELLRHVAPWSANYTEQERPMWNPLMYDSVGQFYPWRKFASATLRSGYIPLWNPYQFCGTPFVANSQSAVFYPGNLLFYLLPTSLAAGFTVILHLTLAASFMWLLMRAIGLLSAAAAFSAIAFAFSTWQVSWLHLPTFLTTSCWLPLVLLLIWKLYESPSWRWGILLGIALGMALLAGHLQIAFYVLLAALALSLWLTISRLLKRNSVGLAHASTNFVGALVFAAMLAGPQILPTLELSRNSHRAGEATESGFEAYKAYAVNPNSTALMLFPDIFGNPSNPRNPYFGTSAGEIPFNYAENALYVGALTLLLAIAALFTGKTGHPLRGFFGLLAVLAVLMALGAWVSRFFYFNVPGFAASGSPGRALVLYAFALAALAGIGLDAMMKRSQVRGAREAAAVLIFLALIGFLYMTGVGVVEKMGGDPRIVKASITPQIGLIAMAILTLFYLPRFLKKHSWTAAIPAGLGAIDLFAAGINYNPTAKPQDVYPITREIQSLQAAGHDRIMPINSNWSFTGPTAVLPPNAAMVFGLRDVQGYDSLFPGQYKAFLNRALGADSSPPEVGNMVFVKKPNLELANAIGVRFLLTYDSGKTAIQDLFTLKDHGARATLSRQGKITWTLDIPTRIELDVESDASSSLRLADQHVPGWTAEMAPSNGLNALQGVPIERTTEGFRSVRVPPGRHTVRFLYEPTGFRFGLYLMMLALSATGVAAGFSIAQRSRRNAVSKV